MKNIFLFIFFGLVVGVVLMFAAVKLYSSMHDAATTTIVEEPLNQLEVTRIDNSRVIFNDSSEFNTSLFELSFIAQLPTETKIPYLVLSGRQCEMCDANISIYIHSPSDGSMKNENEQTRYGMPGELYYWEDNELIAKTRAFYGEVFLNNHGVVWYQTELDENGVWIKSTYFAGISGDTLRGSFIQADIDSTLQQVHKNLAFEIPGISISTEP